MKIIEWSDVEKLFSRYFAGELCASDLYDALSARCRHISPFYSPARPLSSGVTLETATVRTIVTPEKVREWSEAPCPTASAETDDGYQELFKVLTGGDE